LILKESGLPIFKWMETVPEGIDLFITDPPYPFNNQNGTGRFAYKDGEDYMYDRLGWQDLGEVFESMFKMSNPGARAYVFCNRDGAETTKVLLKEAGWTFRNQLVWDKVNFGGGYHWRNSIEYIIYVTNGRPKTYIKGASNKFTYKKPTKRCAIEEIGYDPSACASAKPHEIWRDIIHHGGCEGDVCADPFAGSNPMRAALLLNEELRGKISAVYTNSFETG
jgi:DNA modification methylase